MRVCCVFRFRRTGLPLLTLCDDRGTVGPVTHSFSYDFSLSFDRDDTDDVASSGRSRYTNVLRCHPLGHTHTFPPVNGPRHDLNERTNLARHRASIQYY